MHYRPCLLPTRSLFLTVSYSRYSTYQRTCSQLYKKGSYFLGLNFNFSMLDSFFYIILWHHVTYWSKPPNLLLLIFVLLYPLMLANAFLGLSIIGHTFDICLSNLLYLIIYIFSTTKLRRRFLIVRLLINLPSVDLPIYTYISFWTHP